MFYSIYLQYLGREASSKMDQAFLDYDLGCTLGSGTFGKVRKAVHRPTGQRVAVKVIMKKKIKTEEDRKRVEKETAILKKTQHPNLLKLLQVIDTDESYHLVTQLVEGEELFHKINRLGKLDEQSAGNYFLQLLDAVYYLQNLGICHRDIKPQNIIVRGNSLKLIDFGLGNFFKEGQLLKTSCGSPCYAAPEMMLEKQYDPRKTEIWALGVTLYAMLTGRLPFEHSSTPKLYKIMAVGDYEEIEGVSSSLKSLLKAMIEPNPSLRIDIEDICSHIWVRSFNYEFHPTTNMQWDYQHLNKLARQFNTTKEDLQFKILKQFGSQRVHYFLSVPNSNGLPKRIGPLHLSTVFFSLKAAQNEAKQKYPEAVWKSSTIAETSSQRLQIKQMNKSNIFQWCLQAIQ